MGRRSVNLFKRNDVMRAVNAARDAGVPVASVEIVTNDGTIIKVHGPDAHHDQSLDTWLQRKPAPAAGAQTAKPRRAAK